MNTWEKCQITGTGSIYRFDIFSHVRVYQDGEKWQGMLTTTGHGLRQFENHLTPSFNTRDDALKAVVSLAAENGFTVKYTPLEKGVMMQKITIQCEPVQANTLQPGDLFSTNDCNYWRMFPFFGCVGAGVFVRTPADAEEADAETIVYKITIIREEVTDHADRS